MPHCMSRLQSNRGSGKEGKRIQDSEDTGRWALHVQSSGKAAHLCVLPVNDFLCMVDQHVLTCELSLRL